MIAGFLRHPAHTAIDVDEWVNPSAHCLTHHKCWTNRGRGDVASDGMHMGIVTGHEVTTSNGNYSVSAGNWGSNPLHALQEYFGGMSVSMH